MLTVKPHDIAVLLKVLVIKGHWTMAGLANELCMSSSEVHAALRRTQQAGLFNYEDRKVYVDALEEFLVHGIRYVFLVSKGEVTRGMPTSIAAPPLLNKYFGELEIPPVWPHPLGVRRGYAIEPLYKRLPEAAAVDREFYELAALTDALREKSPRVRGVAAKVLHQAFEAFRERQQ